MISNSLNSMNRALKNLSVCAYHSFVTTRNVNNVVLYLERAKFIDSIRLCLRSDASEASLIDVLSRPGLGSFVVSNALSSAPSPASALYLVDTLKKIPYFTHTKHTLYSLAKILAKSGQTGKLRALIDGINSGKFVNVFPASFMDRMRWYAAAGDLIEVNAVWEEWRQTLNKHPCTESYNLIMKLLVDKGLDSDAVSMFRRMIDEGALPNCRTYTIIIEHLVKRGKLDSALEVFHMLPLMKVKRSRKQYSTLVEAFMGADQLKIVKILLYEMQADGIMPNQAMRLSLQRMRVAGYNNDIEKLIEEMMPDERIKSICFPFVSCDGDVDEDEDEDDKEVDSVCGGKETAVKLKPWLDPAALASAVRQWRPEEVSALEGANFVWTSRFVCKLIRNLKSPETAWMFFCWVARQPTYVHDIYTISRMITKLACHGCVQLVDQLVFKIQREGLKLSFSTIRLIIDFYGFSSKGDAALNIFRNVKTISGPLSKSSQLILYSSLLRTLAKCQMNTEITDILEEMILLGILPDLQTFSGLMHQYALQGDIKTVQKLFGIVRQSNLELDAHTYNILIYAYCKCERSGLALRVFEEMRNSGFMTDGATKEILVKNLWKEGKLREAALVEEMSGDIGDNIPLALPCHLYRGTSTSDLTRILKTYSCCSSARVH